MKRISLLIFISLMVAGIEAVRVKQNGDLLGPVSDASVVSDTVTRSEWDIFLEALIYAESRGNSNAVGTKNDVGVLQITPIYVAEVNRILGEERYTLEDRVDVDKSLEMFCIVQDYHNPKHDINRAIRLHNPGAGDWYRKRILSRMETIKEEESCQQEF